MDENTKAIIDIAKILKEIEDRENIIEKYDQGIFDRNRVIWMIRSLRCSDPIIMYTMAEMNILQPPSNNLSTLENGTNDELINEIKWQLDVLRLELDDKTAKEIVDNMSKKWIRI